MDGASITRLNVLTWHLYNEYPYATDDPGGILESAERAICRAAAEISGLRVAQPWKVSDMVERASLEDDRQALMRFAELAKEAD